MSRNRTDGLKARKSLAIFLIVLAVCFAVIAWGSVSTLQTAKQLVSQGLDTTGVVTAKAAKGGPRDTWLFLSYRFTVDGKNFQGKSRATLETFNSVREGQEISIRYLPANPSVSAYRAEDLIGRETQRLVISGIVIVFLLFAAWCVSYKSDRAQGRKPT